jgi:hypothetical protein
VRYLLAFLLIAPLMAQSADPPAKPDPAASAQKAPDAPPAKTDEKPAESPAPATEDWFTGSIDLGYRALLNNSGNFQEYRSVVNLGDGPRLFSLDFVILDPQKRLFDRIDARANNWGGDPYNTAHLGIVKQGIYHFTADYSNIAFFDAVPSFANPFIPSGFNQQSFDTHRRNTSLNLDLFPGRRIIPYFAYERNSGYGSGIETWVQDSNDEFAVPALFRDSTNNYRGGVHIELNRLHVTLEHGETRFRQDDSASDAVHTTGDVSTPILGQQIYLNGLTQAYGIRGTGSYDKALLTASPFSWLNVSGEFLFSEPKINVSFSELAQGNFLDLTALLFYATQATAASGGANQPHVTGNMGFEVRPSKRLRIIESVLLDREHDAASPYVAEQLLAPGMTPQNILTTLNYKQVVNYNQQQVDAIYDVNSKLTVRAGYRYVWGNATVLAGQLSQTGSLVSGNLQRNVALAGLTFRPFKKLSMNLDYEGASSDNIYFRTSLNNYERGRARANYQLTNTLSAQVRLQVLDNQNPDPSIRYSFVSRDNAVSIFWTPDGGKRISLTGEYDRSTVNSSINYLDLFFSPNVSIYRDDAHTATAAVVMPVPGYSKARLTFGGSLFISSGSRPTRYYQPLARISVPITKHVAWKAEWQWYGFSEAFYLFEGFRTQVFMTGIQVTR